MATSIADTRPIVTASGIRGYISAPDLPLDKRKTMRPNTAAGAWLKEASVKMLKNLGLAMIALSLLAIPAAARNGQKGLRNNGTGKKHGQARAEEVQTANNKGDKDNVPSKGSKSKGEKTRTRKGWHKTAEHNGSSK